MTGGGNFDDRWQRAAAARSTNEPKNGKLGVGHILAAVIPVIAIIGPIIGFYIHDRDAVSEKFRLVEARISDNSSAISRLLRAEQDIEDSQKAFMASDADWRRDEKAYDAEVRKSLNDIAVRLHQRIDALLTLVAVQRGRPEPDYMDVPQRR